MISFSTKLSSAEVASSNTNNEGSRNNALAIASLCFCHPESFTPPSPISVAIHASSHSTKSSSAACFKAYNNAASSASGATKRRFSAIDPLNNCASCDTIPSFCLYAVRLISCISIQFTKKFHSRGAYNHASNFSIVDFPDPDGQTNAIVSPAWIVKETSVSTSFQLEYAKEIVFATIEEKFVIMVLVSLTVSLFISRISCNSS